ncbi:CDP-alcohol phosphatidyltransferase family protein [Modestobacter sp. SYSU DS0290]
MSGILDRPATTPAPAARPRPGEETLRETLHRLGSAQKGAKGAPAYSRFVNRKLGRLLAALAFHARLTPNAVTGISALFTFSGIAALALLPPSGWMGLLVSSCLAVGYAFDSADGQLARLRGGGSPAGEWLDHMVDALKTSSLHLAVLIGWYRFEWFERGPLLLLPLAFCVVAAVFFFGIMLNEALRAQHGVTTRAQPTGERASVLRSLVVLPTDYGSLCWVFLLAGAGPFFLAGYAVLFLAMTGYLAAASVRWFREMSRLP